MINMLEVVLVLILLVITSYSIHYTKLYDLERASRYRKLQKTVQLLSEEVQQPRKFDNLVGQSAVMEELFSQLRRIADSEASLLITGESGSGKELVARAVHHHSRP